MSKTILFVLIFFLAVAGFAEEKEQKDAAIAIEKKDSNEYFLLEGTEWFAFRLDGGSHGGGGMLSFFTLRWKWFYWEILRGGGALIGPGLLGGDLAMYGLGGTSVGVPIHFSENLEHELRFGVGFYGGVIDMTKWIGIHAAGEDKLGYVVMSLEVGYLWHFSKRCSLHTGIESYISLYPDPRASALMGFVGMRFR